MVEILSRSLYSGPRVFVRELLQNATDAITTRREIDEQAPARVRFITDGAELRVIDTGIGLTEAEARQVLATIGASSKRDEFGFERSDLLGQFGIGLLSGFMVSQEITVFSRSARERHADPIYWSGSADGTWQVRPARQEEIPPELPEFGTCVILRSRPGEEYFRRATLIQLVREYGQYLPIQASVEARAESSASEILTHQTPPWRMRPGDLRSWCIDNFGFTPFAAIPLSIPIAGIDGVALVLAADSSPALSVKHHVYLREMLLGKAVTDLAPEWAYFVRIVLNSTHLKPTASREQLFADELLDAVREEIGRQIKTWMQSLREQNPLLFKRFVAIHIDGLKSLALSDADTRKLISETVEYETTFGPLTLAQVIEKIGAIRYAVSVDDFRTMRPVAHAHDICIVNAGYAFDADLLALLALDHPGVQISSIEPIDILSAIDSLDLDEQYLYLPLLSQAEKALDGQDVAVEIRRFAPASLPVLFLPNADLVQRYLRSTNEEGESHDYSELLHAIEDARVGGGSDNRARLILNVDSAIINELIGVIDDRDLIINALRGLYVQALLAGHHPLNTQARSWSTSVFTNLISRTLTPPPAPPTDPGAN